MKNIIVLIIFLASPLLVSSQTLLSDSICCVPCNTLKKALIVKNERDYLKEQIKITRDSSLIFSRIVLNQDSIIKVKNSTISLYKKNENNYLQLIDNKDEEINLYKSDIKKHKRSKIVSYIIGSTCILLSILISL